MGSLGILDCRNWSQIQCALYEMKIISHIRRVILRFVVYLIRWLLRFVFFELFCPTLAITGYFPT